MPGLPPRMLILIFLFPSGMKTSGMMMLSGMSVEMSTSSPPLGAGESISRDKTDCSLVFRQMESGFAERVEGSILNSPMAMVPLLPWR